MVFIDTGFKIYYTRKLCELKVKDLIKVVITPCFFIISPPILLGLSINSFYDESVVRFGLSVIMMTIVFIISTYIFVGKRERNILLKATESIFTKVFRGQNQ